MELRERGKLVRDKIPARIERVEGRAPRYHILAPDAVIPTLLDKLVEEAEELRAVAPSSPPTADERERLLEEFADVAEVLAKLRIEFGITSEAVNKRRKRKCDTHGGFERRVFLEEW